MASKRLAFVWDYDITEDQFRSFLTGTNPDLRDWAIERLLSHAYYPWVWEYITVNDIIEALPRLRLRPEDRQIWERALAAWGYYETN